MARRSLKPEPSPKKRLIILASIAAVGLIAVGITMIIQGEGSDTNDVTSEETTSEDSQPETGTGKNGALSSNTMPGDTGDKNSRTRKIKKHDPKTIAKNPGLASVPLFNGFDKNDEDFPVTGTPASSDPKSKEQQKTGEQLLAEIANEGDRDKLLRQALLAFERSVSEDANNEASRYGLAYTKANIGISFYASSKTSDDASGDSLMLQAIGDGEKAMDLASKADNALVFDISQALVIGVKAAQKQRKARAKSK